MHNIINSFTGFQSIQQETEGKLYPCTIYYYTLQDCHPTNPNPLYTIIDHSDDDEYYDSHDDDEVVEIHIPNRLAAYQLIHDLNERVNSEIHGYANPSNPDLKPIAPLDDATSDIYNAIDLVYLISHYDNDHQ